MASHQTKGPPAEKGVPHVQEAVARRAVRQKVTRPDPFATLQGVLRALEAANITYHLTAYRPDAVSVTAAVPGERWEIDVTEDGEVDFERFVSPGRIDGMDELTAEIARHSD